LAAPEKRDTMATPAQLKPTALNRALAAARPAIVTAVIFSLFINVLALVSPLYMLQVYDRVLSSRNVYTLLFLTLIVVFLLLVYGVLEALRTQVLVRGGVKFDNTIRGPVFASVLFASVSRPGGEPQALRDVDGVREFLTGAGLIAFCDVPWIPVFVFVSFMLHPYFGYLAIASGVIIFLMALANDRATRKSLQNAGRAGIAAQSDATASFRNSEVMHAMGMWAGLQRRWQAKRDELIGWQAAASSRSGGIMACIKFFRQGVQAAILGGGAYLVIRGEVSGGVMIAAMILVGRALAPIEAAVGQWKGFVNTRDSWNRLQELFHSIPNNVERMNLPTPEGRLSVENAIIVPPGSKQPTVRGASFLLEPGMILGIIGPSAAGKSSLVRALVNVWPPASGAVRLDGYDMRHWDQQLLGRHIGYLPQDVELFAGTIAENIARFGDLEMDKILAAAELAGVHEMVQQFPNGYETQIGEGGLALSGGQRQRIALARAVYGMPALIVLDEPNASLDAQGEAALMRALEGLKAARRTIVFVTHKTNIVSMADKLAAMSNGAIHLFGDRDEVLAKLFGGPRPVAMPTGSQTAQGR